LEGDLLGDILLEVDTVEAFGIDDDRAGVELVKDNCEEFGIWRE
jgi:hypothetical protein